MSKDKPISYHWSCKTCEGSEQFVEKCRLRQYLYQTLHDDKCPRELELEGGTENGKSY